MFTSTISPFKIDPDSECSLWHYMAYGLEPGGMLTSILENDWYNAVSRAHPSLPVSVLKGLQTWVEYHAPIQSYGSADKMVGWYKLTNEERRDIMIECGLRPSVIDILKGTHKP